TFVLTDAPDWFRTKIGMSLAEDGPFAKGWLRLAQVVVAHRGSAEIDADDAIGLGKLADIAIPESPPRAGEIRRCTRGDALIVAPAAAAGTVVPHGAYVRIL